MDYNMGMSKLPPAERAVLVARLADITAKAQATNLTRDEWSKLQQERESLARSLARDDHASRG
jgi:vancomycin permeability regulator SanA